jgi:hypothetical protein
MIQATVGPTPYHHPLYVSTGADLLFSFEMYSDTKATVPMDLDGAQFEMVVYDALGAEFLLLTETDGIVITDNLVTVVLANSDFDGLVWGCSYRYRLNWVNTEETNEALFAGHIMLSI